MNLTELIERIRKFVSLRHARVIARLLGHEALTPAELALVRSIPTELLSVPEQSLIERAYQHGLQQAQQFGIQVGPQVGIPQVETHQTQTQPVSVYPAREGTPYQSASKPNLSSAELASIEYAKQSAAQAIRSAGDRLEAELTREFISQRVSRAIEERQTVAQLSSKLKSVMQDKLRDWDRVAATELHNASQIGYADASKERFGEDALVFKRPNRGACEKCLELYLAEDGSPRIFKLSELEANGDTNVGRKKADWLPVVGVTHPFCFCTLQVIPPGWHFRDGRLLPQTTDISDASDTTEKSLNQEFGATPNKMGDRAVMSGSAGPNLIVRAPIPIAAKPSTQFREAMVEFAAGIETHSPIIRPASTYEVSSPCAAPIHPIEEYDQVLDQLAYTDSENAEAVMNWLRQKTEARADASRLVQLTDRTKE